MAAADLQGCVLGIFVAEGIACDELKSVGDRLHDLGAKVHYLGVGGRSVKMQDGTELVTDVQAEEISPRYYDALVVPDCNAATLRQHGDELDVLLRNYVELRRPIGAIGEGVLLLADAGILKGRKVAAKGDVRDELEHKGAIVDEQGVVVDRTIVTAADSGAIEEFCELLAGEIVSRMRDYVDEVSMESFPGSDSPGHIAI